MSLIAVFSLGKTTHKSKRETQVKSPSYLIVNQLSVPATTTTLGSSDAVILRKSRDTRQHFLNSLKPLLMSLLDHTCVSSRMLLHRHRLIGGAGGKVLLGLDNADSDFCWVEDLLTTTHQRQIQSDSELN